MSENSFSVRLKLIENYLFEIDFAEFGNFMTDEPEPLGGGEGPNPSRLLAAAVGNCLAASLLFALRKYGDDPGEVKAVIDGELERVDKRWRITHMTVTITMDGDTSQLPHLDKALHQFEDFCVVTQSVRQGIDVTVKVLDKDGKPVQ